jgi:cellulose synthase/poly-beta-1,6-N-acetylglucosamine synthase-like glycosyltransferase
MSSLAIIVPMYNPHKDSFEFLCNSLEKLDSIFKDIEYSVVLVNDGSTDFEESNIKKLTSSSNKILYFSYEVNQGKGYAVRFGVSKIQADFYVYTDIDFPFGYEVINSMYQMFTRSSTNLIVGIRDKKYFKMLPLKRRIISKTIHNINNVLTGFRVHDTQAGIKGFDNEAKKVLLATKTKEFLFDLEFIRNCLRHRLKYSTIKINARPEIMFCDFSTTVIKQELKNLIKIIIKY